MTTALTQLADRLEAASDYDNALDVLVECALFKPGTCYTAARPNSAGTKVIYTDRAGNSVTCWADDWTTVRKAEALERLRALAQKETEQ